MKPNCWFILSAIVSLVVLGGCSRAAPPPSPATQSTAKPAAAAPTVGSNAQPTETGRNLIVSYSELTPINLPLWLAVDQGYFTKNGLTIDARYIQSSLGVSALLAGDEQFAAMGGSETLAAVINGADLEVLACFSPVYPYKLEVQQSVSTAADLKGKKLGVSRFGSSSDSATRAALQQLGLDPQTDVTLVQVGSLADRTAALLNGSLDGAVDGLPDTLILEQHGLHPLLDLAAQRLPAVNNVLVARKSWVNAHKDITQAYVDAIVRGVAKAKSDKELSLALIKKYLKSRAGDDAQVGAAYDYDITEVMELPPRVHRAGFHDALAQIAKTKQSASDFDLSTIIDNSFVESAIARGLGKADQ
jgi:ABC-type nitrate/sulfonate/bicarbonate transport system substrate-binding protein